MGMGNGSGSDRAMMLPQVVYAKKMTFVERFRWSEKYCIPVSILEEIEKWCAENLSNYSITTKKYADNIHRLPGNHRNFKEVPTICLSKADALLFKLRWVE